MPGAGAGRSPSAVSSTFYLHGSGGSANPPLLYLDNTAPSGSSAKYKDSPGVSFSGGNPWKEVGVLNAGSNLTSGSLIALGELHVWLGLKNSDDQGTYFDLRAEVRRNGVVIGSGETYRITGISRNANQAKEAVVTLSNSGGVFNGDSDQLSLRILTRIGTDGSGGFGGGHSNATGLRLYFDSMERPSRFGATQNTGPSAVANANPASGTAPLEVAFDAAGSQDPDGVIVKWEWDLLGNSDFQDYTLTQGLAAFTYVNGETYYPMLRVTDDSGATATASTQIYVNSAPNAAAAATPDFGYPPMEVAFDATASSDSDGTIEKYEWDFGEGGGFVDYGTSPLAAHTYSGRGNYTALLRVTDDFGATSTAALSIDTTQIPPNQGPAAEATVVPQSGTQPLTVSFDGSASTDPDGSIVMWEWDFGDGNGFQDTTATQGLVQFTYINAGEMTATLRVTDNDNATDTLSFNIHVNAKPNALGEAFPDSGNAPLPVQFNANGSDDPDGSLVMWEWDFGEGGGFEDCTASLGTGSHTYPLPGTYPASLRVTDNEGGQDVFNLTVHVNFPPAAALSADPASGTAPLSVSFDASASSDPDGPIVKYEWDFDGNGSWDLDSGTTATANFTYSAAGAFSATVRVTDQGGLTDTADVTISVEAPPADWNHTLGRPNGDWARDCAVDPNGNVYVVGRSEYDGLGQTDALLCRFNPNGSLAWQKRWGGAQADEGVAVACDDAGNVFIAGNTESYPLAGLGNRDVFVLKLTSGGTLVWQRTYGFPNVETMAARALEIGADGNPVLMFQSSWNYTAIAILKLRSDTGGILWQRDWVVGSTFAQGGLAVGPTGNIIVTATSNVVQPWDNCLLKMDGGGNYLWSVAFTLPGYEVSNNFGVALDSAEDIYLGGRLLNKSTGAVDGYVAKLNPTATAMYACRRWGEAQYDEINSLGLDAAGDVYAAGQTLSFGSKKLALFKLDSNLTLNATERWTGSGSVYDIVALAVDPNENLPVVAAAALNNSGSWEPFTANWAPIATYDMETFNSNFNLSNFNFGDPQGVCSDASAVLDSGAGGTELFVSRRQMDSTVPDPGAPWAAPVVVDASSAGHWSSMAIVNGRPAISHFTGNATRILRFSRANDTRGTTWGTCLSLDGGNSSYIGVYTALVVTNGVPAVAYQDNSNYDLRFISAQDPSGAGWNAPQNIDSAGNTGHYNSMAIVNGCPAVVFTDLGYGIKYMRALDAAGTSWGGAVVLDSQEFMQAKSLTVVNGNPAVAYYANNRLRYKRANDPNGTSWGAAAEPEGTAWAGQDGVSLSVVSGNPAISYQYRSANDLHFIRASDANGGSWGTAMTLDAVGSVGSNSSLVVVYGVPAISYWDETNTDLKYVQALDASGATWSAPVRLDDMAFGAYTSMQVVEGHPAIAYPGVGGLRYITKQ